MTELMNGIKITISRNRTKITTCFNMVFNTGRKSESEIITAGNSGKRTEYNYKLRLKKRRNKVRELCHNSFSPDTAVFLSLTFDAKKFPDKDLSSTMTTHRLFNNFTKRVNDHYENFKYIATFSKQGCGNIHYHVMCNFDKKITEKDVADLWKNGSIEVNYLKSYGDYLRAVDYLIKNMDEESEDKQGRRGYLYSKNIEHDIILSSWREETITDYNKAFEEIMDFENNPIREIYETNRFVGAMRETQESEDCISDVEFIPVKEMTDSLKNEGYRECHTICTHFASEARFEDKFSELTTATLREKKFKRPKKSC